MPGRATTTGGVTAFVATFLLAAAPLAGSQLPGAPNGGAPPDHPVAVRVISGDSIRIGDGVIRTWVEVDADGVPMAVGVTLPERVFEALTDEGFLLSLDYPEVEGLPFRHVLFDWVPHGHPPAGLYAHAHWDSHFYTITAEERLRIEQGVEEEAPEPRFLPEGYIPVPGLGHFAFPEMGVHWMHEEAAELHGHTFDQTLIYGSTGDRMIFVEPMFTMDFLATKPDLTAPVPQPVAVQESGFYPTRYVIRHEARAGAFRIAIEGFRWREEAARQMDPPRFIRQETPVETRPWP